MQLSANTQVKTIEGHYTGHFKAVITKPQNVLVMRDVACSGYVTGCNTTWFAEDSPGVYSLQSAATNIMKRLSFADDAGARYGSMLSYPAFDEQFRSGHLDTVMSITTRLLPWEVTSATGGDHNSFPGGENMFKLYQQMLNLRQVHFGEDMKAAENQDFISQGSTNNATCFLGPHRVYDPFTKSFMNLIPGQGHCGPDAIPGDARWRRGVRPPAPPRSLCDAVLTPSQTRSGERLPQDGARHARAARARAARADGLHAALVGAATARAREKRTRVCVWCGWGREVGG